MPRSKRSRSLEYQLWYTIENAYQKPGASKRAEMRANGGAGAKVYSNNYRGELFKFGRGLADFCRTQYPKARLLSDITPNMVQEWLDSKGGVSPATAETYTSYLAKLCKVVNKTYKSAGWDFSGVSVPVDSQKAKQRTISWDEATLERLQERVDAGRSRSASRGLTFARITGARVTEAASWVYEPSRVSWDGGRWGHGWIEIGKTDGAKGGRLRRVSLLNAQDSQKLRDLLQGMHPGERMTEYGGRTPGESLDRALRRGLDAIGVKDAKQNVTHSIRKGWARRVYDATYEMERANGQDPMDAHKKATETVNEELGHSKNRDDETEAYLNGYQRTD